MPGFKQRRLASQPVHSRAVAERQILALGGSGETEEQNDRLARYVVGLTRKAQPRLLLVPTASADDASGIVRFYERFAGVAEVAHLPFFPWPPAGLRELVLRQDAVFVGGGNTANMLAVWRVHGLDEILREAWESGVVLAGWSAGMICWFEAGITDSFGPQLEGMRDGLAFLRGSACPHYDGEERRRPRYRELIAGGFPPGLAVDDGVGVLFRDTEIAEIVSVREGASAYRVDADGESVLPAEPI
jgi:peptidase E